jgi:hypothetical protein
MPIFIGDQCNEAQSRPMTRLRLGQVTLCAVDARSPALAAEALQRSRAQIGFARCVLFTHGYAARPDGVEVVDVGPIRSGVEYSRFVLRRLPAFVDTPHVLVTQWDGFVLNASAWCDEFLAWDYVGAVWADPPAAGLVGNGGFSLRSRRLLDAGLDPRIEHEHPEDLMLAQRYRGLLEREHGVRFAPPALARRFAYENEVPREPTFGFHGPKNLAEVLDATTLERWLAELPDDFFRGRDARRLARALLRRRMAGVARQLVARRRASGRNDFRTRTLGWMAAALGAMPGGGGRSR